MILFFIFYFVILSSFLSHFYILFDLHSIPFLFFSFLSFLFIFLSFHLSSLSISTPSIPFHSIPTPFSFPYQYSPSSSSLLFSFSSSSSSFKTFYDLKMLSSSTSLCLNLINLDRNNVTKSCLRRKISSNLTA